MTQIEAAPPSHGDKVAFHASVDLVWRVVDLSKVVLNGVKDVGMTASPSCSAGGAVTRQYEIEAPEKAEKAANEEFDSANLGAEFGLSMRVFVRSSMDDSSRVHAAIQRKVEVFRDIIAAGDYNQFALQLAMNPHDVHTVVELLGKERDSHRQAVFDFVTRLLESDALDRWQIDDQVRITLQRLCDSGYKVLTGTDEARPVYSARTKGNRRRGPISHDRPPSCHQARSRSRWRCSWPARPPAGLRRFPSACSDADPEHRGHGGCGYGPAGVLPQRHQPTSTPRPAAGRQS